MTTLAMEIFEQEMNSKYKTSSQPYLNHLFFSSLLILSFLQKSSLYKLIILVLIVNMFYSFRENINLGLALGNYPQILGFSYPRQILENHKPHENIIKIFFIGGEGFIFQQLPEPSNDTLVKQSLSHQYNTSARHPFEIMMFIII